MTPSTVSSSQPIARALKVHAANMISMLGPIGQSRCAWSPKAPASAILLPDIRKLDRWPIPSQRA